jgi:hypothetical protein
MRKRTAMSPRRAATAAAGRGWVNTSPVGRVVRGTAAEVAQIPVRRQLAPQRRERALLDEARRPRPGTRARLKLRVSP